MTEKIVDLEALNFRTEPRLSPSNRIGILRLGQRTTVIGPAEVPGWLKVQADIPGGRQEGFIKEEIDELPTLRSAASSTREALVAQAIAEWLRFEKGLGQEHHAPFYEYVGEMWQAIGLSLDGKDRDTPWSAAAISFMVRNAAKDVPSYGNFKFAAAHSRFMHDSIKQRQNNNPSTPFWGFRLHERQPLVGDIVGRWRETPRDFEDAAIGDAFKSHSDIIVSVQPDFVLAIGGNVAQSVSITRHPKTAAGYLSPENGVFIHLVNRA